MAIAQHAAPTPGNLAIADMCSIAFFYLLRLGEYYTVSIQLRSGNRRLDLFLATADADIRSATFAKNKNNSEISSYLATIQNRTFMTPDRNLL
jgi:hypothetical protein